MWSHYRGNEVKCQLPDRGLLPRDKSRYPQRSARSSALVQGRCSNGTRRVIRSWSAARGVTPPRMFMPPYFPMNLPSQRRSTSRKALPNTFALGMRAIDTNVLVRLMVRDDAEQLRAAEDFVSPGAWVSPLVLAEALWVLVAVYGRTPDQIASAVELLLDHKTIAIQDADAASAALVEFRRQPRLGFSDCLILELARRAGHLPLGTFDRELAKTDDVIRLT